MTLRFAGVLAVAACSSGTGAYVTVRVGSTTADQVALYVGLDSEPTPIDPFSNANVGSGSGSGFVGPLSFGSGSGTGAFDEVAVFDAVPIKDGAVTFHLDAAKTGMTVQLIAIGSVSDPTDPVGAAHVYDITVPIDQAVDVDMKLTPVMPASPTTEIAGPRSAELAKVWSSSFGTCVMLEDWDGGGSAARTLIVPTHDPDCDGFATGDPTECKPYWFQFESTTQPDFNDASCALSSNSGSGSGSCYLGGSVCQDGRPGGTCEQVQQPTACLPAGACASQTCAQPQATTPATSFLSCANSTAVHCEVYATSGGQPCDSSVFGTLSSTVATIDLTLGPDGNSNALFGQGATCQSMWSMDQDTFAMPAPTVAAEVDVAGVTLTFKHAGTTACQFDVNWTTGTFQQITTTAPQIIGLELANGTTLVLPLTVEELQCPTTAPSAIICSLGVAPSESGFSGCLNP